MSLQQRGRSAVRVRELRKDELNRLAEIGANWRRTSPRCPLAVTTRHPARGTAAGSAGGNRRALSLVPMNTRRASVGKITVAPVYRRQQHHHATGDAHHSAVAYTRQVHRRDHAERVHFGTAVCHGVLADRHAGAAVVAHKRSSVVIAERGEARPSLRAARAADLPAEWRAGSARGRPADELPGN